MVLKIEHPQFFYDLFYQLSFLVVLVIFMIEGFRRKIPLMTVLLILVTTRIFSIAGSNLVALDSSGLRYFLQNFSFPEAHSRNMIGTLMFGLLGLGVAKLLLKIKYPVFDAFAIAVPFGMAVQRLGCLFAGCCFGKETSLPIGIQYGVNSPAFLHEFYSGRLGLSNELSLHIHPVPVYLILHSLLVGIVLLKFGNLLKRPGNLALAGLSMILLGWFFIEFYRDPLSNSILGSEIFWGVKRIQLAYLAFSTALFVVVVVREKYYRIKTFGITENTPLQNSLYLLFLIGLLFLNRNFYTTLEVSVILFVLVPAVIGIVVQIIQQFYTPTVRALTASFIVLLFILMGQTLPEKQVYKSLKFGFTSGSFETYHNKGTGTGCDRVSESQYFYQKYTMAGLGYSTTTIEGTVVKEWGINGYFGSNREIGETTGLETVSNIVGINPYVKYDNRWYGAGGGIHLGDLAFAPPHWVEETSSVLPVTGLRKSVLLPQFYIRVGPPDIVFASYKFADQFPSPFPGLYQSLELGSGFGEKSGFNIRVGTNLANSGHIAAYIPIQNRVVIEPFFQFGYSLSDKSEYSSRGLFSLGLHYRLGNKAKPKL